MDAALYAKMLSDKNITDFKKLKYKYPDADMPEFFGLLKLSAYKTISLPGFAGEELVYLENAAQVRMSSVKLLLALRSGGDKYGLNAMEDEISSTLTIEDIDFSRESVRKILKGYAPSDDSEVRIYGMKKGLEFISDPQNKISEQNIHKLYELAIGNFLQGNDKLLSGNYYRHDDVYIVGQELEHTGLPHQKLAGYMAGLIEFINEESRINDLLKAAVIHFYIAYLHPYFDGNGRMARLIHLWYLVRQGYSAALFIPFSSYVQKSRKDYYKSYTLIKQNAKISGMTDVTPFLVYFVENVYNKIADSVPQPKTIDAFQRALDAGKVTEKEKDLWHFVLSAYGTDEFSTKKLERDFGNAAYATIRGFVLKFEVLGLLAGQKYGNRMKYRVNTG